MARNRALYHQEVLLGNDIDNPQTLDGHAFSAHAARHAPPFHRMLWKPRPNRTRCAERVLRAVTCWTTVETVSLHHARESAPFGDPRNLNDVTNRKRGDRDRVSARGQFHPCWKSKLSQRPKERKVLQVSALRLAEMSFFGLPKPQLDIRLPRAALRGVSQRPDQCYGAGSCLQYRHRDGATVVLKNRGHPNFLCQDRFHANSPVKNGERVSLGSAWHGAHCPWLSELLSRLDLAPGVLHRKTARL